MSGNPPIPKFSDLPLRPGDPHHSAWGLYGPDDQLGTLNRLTEQAVLNAAKGEIKEGVRISLNWPMDAQGDLPFFGRAAFHKEVYLKPPRIVNDDVWTFNTQSSSQYRHRAEEGDGLRHFAYQEGGKFYGGVTLDDIHGENKTNVNGIHAWSEKGIVGRGILLDFHRWRLVNNIPYNPFKTESISLSQLKAVAEAQGTEIKFGDILIIRSGFMVAYNNLNNKRTIEGNVEVNPYAKVNPPPLGGVEQNEEVLQWIWENFSAVAGDQPAFECWPSQMSWKLHEVLLAGWGCPIGELFDLEKLAEHCDKTQRWSFFVTSEVCNVPGGVASPPNILAIF